jgi:hypothetical protein
MSENILNKLAPFILLAVIVSFFVFIFIMNKKFKK